MSSYQNIISNLGPKFAHAKKTGAIFFFDSTVKDVDQNGKRFQIRVCPALKDKKTATEEASKRAGVSANTEQVQPKSSPFEPPYIDDLHVGDVEGPVAGEDGMAVLLNKYAILPEHFLVVTKTKQPQSLPPSPAELLSTYNLLLAASEHPSEPRRCFAFYNGGKGAGASQSWRHLQVIEVPRRSGAPVETWMGGIKTERRDKPFAHPDLPHLHLVHHLPEARDVPYPPTEESNQKMMDALRQALLNLLDAMFQALQRGGGRRDGGWNLLMTLEHLHLIPRSNPTYIFPGNEGQPPSELEVNALGCAGMLLTKSDEELDRLLHMTDKPEEGKVTGLMRVLQHCGVPRQWADEPEATHTDNLATNDLGPSGL